jgi:hypothetical protein
MASVARQAVTRRKPAPMPASLRSPIGLISPLPAQARVETFIVRETIEPVFAAPEAPRAHSCSMRFISHAPNMHS